jgi:hypothetical protein
MEAGGGESCGDGGIVLEASGAAAAADTKKDPENDRGGCEADQDKNPRNSTRIPKKAGRKTMG